MVIEDKYKSHVSRHAVLKSHSGFALVTVLLLVSLMAVIGITLNRTTGLQSTMSYNLQEADEAYFVANAGIQHAIFLLKQIPSTRGVYANVPFSTGAYSFTISEILSPKGNPHISSEGNTGTSLRLVEKTLFFEEILTVYPPLLKDTYIYERRDGKNFGTSDMVRIGVRDEDAERGLFEFDMSVIPVGSKIKTAVFELYMYDVRANNVYADSHNDIKIYRLTRSWNEGIHDNEDCDVGATWREYNCNNNWSNQGGDYDGHTFANTRVDYVDINLWHQWDVKSLVEGWVKLDYTNFGMILKDDKELGNSKRFRAYFYSDEYSDVSLRPKLTVTYTAP